MRIFIPSFERAMRISTHRLLKGLDWTVVVHNDAEADAYRRHSGIPTSRLIVSGVEPSDTGIWHQRKWICQNLAEPGEWFVFADDNIRAFRRVHPKFYDRDRLPVTTQNSGKWQKVYGVTTGGDELMALWEQDVARAEEIGTGLVGFATTGNPLFRTKHYGTVGYVITKCALWRNDPETDWSTPVNMDDFQFTGERLLRHGKVLINRFLFPESKHYEEGGIGPYETRVNPRRRSVRTIMRQYPGLFRVKDRKGFAPNTDLQLRLTTEKQIALWRAEMLRGRADDSGA